MVGRWRRPRLLLRPPPLLLRALLLLGFLLPGAPALRVHHTFDNIKEMQIALNPTMTVQISSETADSFQAQEPSHIFEVETTNEEEKTLNNLVGLLQDMVKNIPTASAQAQTPKPAETATVVISSPESSPSESAGTVVLKLNPKTEEMEVDTVETVSQTNENAPTTTTAFWDLRNDRGASVVLHSDTPTSEGNAEEQTEKNLFYSSETTPEQSLVSMSFLLETDTTTQKAMTFDQLTNGALASLVESLRNVRKMHVKLTHTDNESKQGGTEISVTQSPEKSVSAEILELIDRLIETIKNAPPSVKEDPALNTYLEKAESYLKSALELAGEAEKRLEKGKAESVMKVVIPSIESENMTVVIPSESENVTVVIPSESENVTVVIPPSESEKVTVVIPPSESEKVTVVIPHTEPEKVTAGIPNTEPEKVTVVIAHTEPEKKAEAEGPPPGQEWVETEKNVEVVLPPLPSETVPESTVAIQLPSPESVEEKAKDTQVEMGKLKAFINLLYGFSPHLTAYAQNSANKKVAEDIVDRAMEVLQAIKSIFCGNPEGQSKMMLQQLLKKDMELVRQAMKEKRAS